ncbi:MAG TPA: hypothetical protein DCE23_09295 [Firmicutes bacterium]|nr:hypothetical protein [Bacillota bacterium]
MKREKALVKNTLIITIGKICTQLITFFLLPLYTGILSTEEFGIVDLLNTLVSLLLPIVTFQVEKALFRELIEVRDSDKDKTSIISNSIFSVIAQCILYLVIFIVISTFVNNKYKYFLATNVIAYIFSSLLLQTARGLGDNKKYAIGSFISAFFTIIFNIIFLVVIKLGANGMLLGTLLGHLSCVVYLFFSLKVYKYINIKAVDNKIIRRLWTYSIPLIPNAISWWVFNASDRVIVSAFLGLSSNGLLSAATKFSTVYITLYNMFDMSWTESMALHINDDDIEDYFSKVFNIMINLFISLAMGIIACMPFVYPILINEKFALGYGLVPILIIASFFNVIVGLISVIYVAKKNTKAIANTSVFAAICNIVTHLCLIKFIGLYAAVVSTLVSYFVMTLYRIYDINKKYFKIYIPINMMIKSA